MTSAVVIGGGVIGLSVAWRAAQRGLAVTVIDPAPGSGATRAAAGMLTPVTEVAYAEKDLLRLGIESLRRYPDFAAELTRLTGEPTGFRQDGTMQVGYDADDMAVIGEVHALQEAFGVAAQRLTARECRAAEPLLDPAVRGGLLTAGDGSVDPRRLVRALLAAAGQAGVSMLRQPAAEVIGTGGGDGRAGTVPSAAGRAAGVRLADGTEVAADWVVLAAGWESAGLAGLPPAAMPPVRPVKGQILRLRAGPQAGQLSRSVRGVVRGRSVYLVPRLDSELVIGATQEEMGADTRVTAGGVWELLRDARTLIPAITEFGFAEACAGLRPGTPDNAPVLGPSGLPGLVLVTGHFRAGVLLAPITAEAVAEYLVTQQLAAPAVPFTLERFRREEPGSPAGPARPPAASSREPG
ncbi:MAG: glycine oxidase ThiO [Nocardiopsaceae bacterium]|nr:glycine oxidase ThiO [Nocardiopsaceae bacterium]